MINLFKSLNPGVKRLILIGAFTVPLFFCEYRHGVTLEHVVAPYILFLSIYWIITFIALWIIEGFTSNK